MNEVSRNKYNRYYRNLKSGFITQSLLSDYSIGILTVLFDKKIVKKKCFNQKYNIIGDFDYFLRLSIKNKIAYMAKPLASYRIHNNNYSTNNLEKYVNELRNWIKKNSLIYKSHTFFYLRYYLFKLRIKLFFKIFFGRVVQW